MAFDLVKATEAFLCRPRFRGHSDCHFYPSEASVITTDQFGDRVIHGGCLRASYFRCTGEEGIPHSARSQGIFELGKAVEDMLVNDWKQMGIFVARGVRFQNPEFNLSGELDAILRDPETGLLFGTEVKSFYGYHASVEIFGNKSTVGKPKKNNLLQTLVYLNEFQRELDHFKLFYEDRGDGSKRSFDIRIVTSELEDGTVVHYPKIDNSVIKAFTIEDLYGRYAELCTAMIKGTVPERDFELAYSNERIERDHSNGKISDSKFNKFKKVSKKDGSVRYVEKDRPGDWQCSYCKFKDLCWK